jgi:hypothetical protein
VLYVVQLLTLKKNVVQLLEEANSNAFDITFKRESKNLLLLFLVLSTESILPIVKLIFLF